MPEPQDVARAFSMHRFEETYEHLDDDVRWVIPGGDDIEGRAAVTRACRDAAAEFSETRMDVQRLVVAGPAAPDGPVAVDAVARYTGPDGDTSVVSSCDVYEFRQGRVVTITTYAVELDQSADPVAG
jgi:ketosteroid isomerase-like protein